MVFLEQPTSPEFREKHSEGLELMTGRQRQRTLCRCGGREVPPLLSDSLGGGGSSGRRESDGAGAEPTLVPLCAESGLGSESLASVRFSRRLGTLINDSVSLRIKL